MKHLGPNPGADGRRGASSLNVAFTLIELLVVIAIIVLAMSMIVFLPSSDRREAVVHAAAQELAGTLRYARSLAMEKRALFGIAFNIQNGPDTSGRVLNNRNGGHWYRLVGPAGNTLQFFADKRGEGWPIYPYAVFGMFTAGASAGNDNTSFFLRLVQESWVGERHVLAPRKVRFLALSDQDNGCAIDPASAVAATNTYPATYPRPWFGYWEAGRLYPWGGYDHSITDARGQHCSAFHFEGDDGAITGCLNPSDRISGDGESTKIFAAGTPRPLVNADWLDYLLEFRPDGSVAEGDLMRARRRSWQCGSAVSVGPAPGDLGAYVSKVAYSSDPVASEPLMVMSSYVGHTGFYAITLCPDINEDTDLFPHPQAALRTLMPMYRVMINRFGLVKVVKVSGSSPRDPAGNAIPVTIDNVITDWQSSAQTSVNYQRNVLCQSNGSKRGMPVMDFLTADILGSRQWWMVVP